MIGWLGHELGHVMDYRSRSGFGMMIFGLRYLYSKNYLKEAERRADSFAIRHGMGNYIIATKNFILNHSDISEKYKDRIRRLYLSPEEIMEMVNTMEPEEIRDEIDEEIRSDAGLSSLDLSIDKIFEFLKPIFFHYFFSFYLISFFIVLCAPFIEYFRRNGLHDYSFECFRSRNPIIFIGFFQYFVQMLRQRRIRYILPSFHSYPPFMIKFTIDLDSSQHKLR